MERSSEHHPHTIKISVIDNNFEEPGNFNYGFATLRVRLGDFVAWESENGPFVVSFGERTPFQGVDFQSEKSEKDTTGRLFFKSNVQKVLDDTAPGIYKYSVAVFVESKKKVFIDHCPELMIGP